MSCVPGTPELDFTGELLATDEAVATFAGPDGVVEILVIEKIGFLDVGRNYRVSATRAFGEPTAFETTIAGSSSCDCGDGIRHEDGGVIDTSWWTGVNRNYPVRAWTILILGIPIITLVAVSVNRLRRGGDHDPYVDLPDDGSWIEYDGYIDE